MNDHKGNINLHSATHSEQKETQSIFIGKGANKWVQEASEKPIPNKLFGDLIYEGEVTLLFADTNVGKSILAVQIADLLAKGKSFSEFTNEASPMTVLYYAFELGERQFGMRYAEQEGKQLVNPYCFSENLHRLEIDPDLYDTSMEDPSEQIFQSFSLDVKTYRAEILIVDNITWLRADAEKGSAAASLMKGLRTLCKIHNITILVLAHTPKRAEDKELSLNDLAGSRYLAAFADAIFAIGKSLRDGKSRYLKQLKERSCEKAYGANWCPILKIEKPVNFLGFSHDGFMAEYDLLQDGKKAERDDLEQALCEAYKNAPDASNRELGRLVGKDDHKWVKRTLEKHGLLKN